MLTVISLLCLGVVAAGCVSTVLEIAAIGAFARRAEMPAAAALVSTGVTLLKPLHGAEDGLDENLRSFCIQDYAGPVQLLFGVAEAADPAGLAVRRLQQAFPEADIELVVTGRAQAGNAKVANLAGMSPAIKHPLIVMSDSDIRVGPDYLRRTVAALQRPGVGLVTCLYRGEGAGGLWALLSAMAIDYQFFPSVLLGLRVGRGEPCVGATMAFRTETLAAIGGFAAFSNYLADDHAVGAAVQRTGQRVEVAGHVVEHRCLEASARQLVQHELRWARTIRSIDPWGYAGSVVMHPLAIALAAAALRGFDALGSGALAIALLCRLALQWQVDRTLRPLNGLSAARLALLPLRDILSFAVFCASFATAAVVWRGRRFRIRGDGTMVEWKGSGS